MPKCTQTCDVRQVDTTGAKGKVIDTVVITCLKCHRKAKLKGLGLEAIQQCFALLRKKCPKKGKRNAR